MITFTLDLLCPDAPVEIRVKTAAGKMVAKRFLDREQAEQWVDQFKDALAVYVVMNPFDETKIKKHDVDDEAVTRRKWVLIDADPQRATGTNSTDDEVELATAITNRVKQYLSQRGWPDPVEALSGNGAHLLYAVDFPNTEDVKNAINALLKHLAERFNTPGVSIDQTVGNASRITKLYGTMTRKGPHTDERPQRMSSITVVPPELRLVPFELFNFHTTSADAPTPKPKSLSEGMYSLEHVLAQIKRYSKIYSVIKNGDVTRYQIDCPWKAEHSTQPDGPDGTMFTWGDDNAAGFTCAHSSCKSKGRDWKAFAYRLNIKPRYTILSVEDPLVSAREFVRQRYYAEDVMTMHHQSSVFYVYQTDVGAYQDRDEPAVRSDLYKFLETAKVWSGGKPATEKKAATPPTMEPFRPNKSKVENVLDALRAVCNLPAHQAPPVWLAEDPGLKPVDILACRNGLLHIPTRTLYKPTPHFFTLNGIELSFDPYAPEPVHWLEFLRSIWPSDPESIDALQEMFGYLLTPDTKQQKIFMLHGPKRSGKGLIGRILRALIGERNACSPTLSSFDQDFGKHVLIGKSIAVVSDARISGKADTARVAETLLSISGEDPQTIPRKFLGDWNGRLHVRFVILTNELPRIGDSSGALASRFLLLAMTESFFGREDLGLYERLAGDLPGILNWALAGRDRLTQRGHFLQPASAMELAQEFDDLGSLEATFLRHKVVKGDKVSQKDLFAAWCAWCKENGRDYPGTIQVFSRNVRAILPHVTTSQIGGHEDRERYWIGIQLSNGPVDVPF